MFRIIRLLFIISIPLLFLTSCTPPTTRPIGIIHFTPISTVNNETLLVFLPGIRDRAKVYAEQGFITALEQSGIKAEMIGVDAHIGYYKKMEFLARLKEDVVLPAKQKGYKRIWLVGISLGGFGAIWYDLENPGDLAGIVSLAPYLGEEEVVSEVEAAGGLKTWQPPEGKQDDQHRIWQALKGYGKPGNSAHRVFLGYGIDDKFALPDSMLAAILPVKQVFAVEGGHDWPTWRKLWGEILMSGLFDGKEGY